MFIINTHLRNNCLSPLHCRKEISWTQVKTCCRRNSQAYIFNPLISVFNKHHNHTFPLKRFRAMPILLMFLHMIVNFTTNHPSNKSLLVPWRTTVGNPVGPPAVAASGPPWICTSDYCRPVVGMPSSGPIADLLRTNVSPLLNVRNTSFTPVPT